MNVAQEAESNRWERRTFGNEVEVAFGLRVAELADGIVWLGLVVSTSEMAGICLQSITPC